MDGEEETKDILEILRGNDIEVGLAEIRKSIRLEQAMQISWKQLFTGGATTRRVLLGVRLQATYVVHPQRPNKSTIH